MLVIGEKFYISIPIYERLKDPIQFIADRYGTAQIPLGFSDHLPFVILIGSVYYDVVKGLPSVYTVAYLP